MKIIAVAIQKGGTGKSTSSLNIAYGLHDRGKRVLLIDGDPQSNATAATGADATAEETNLYDVMKGNGRIVDALQTVKMGLDLLSVGLAASAADFELTALGREYLLRDALNEINGNYDFCVIDTAPSLGILTMNALTAADTLLIPCELDMFAIQGLTQLSGFIENIRKYSNPRLKVAGLVITKYDTRAQLSKALLPVLSEVSERLEIPVIQDIPKSADLAKARTLHNSIYEFAPKSRAGLHYSQLVDYLMEGI